MAISSPSFSAGISRSAAKMSDGIRADAEREGKLIIADAQQKAELIVRDSRDQLKRVYQEIAELKRIRMQFEVNLRSVCQAHVAMIDQSHFVQPDPQINLAQAQNGFAAVNNGPAQAAPVRVNAAPAGAPNPAANPTNRI